MFGLFRPALDPLALRRALLCVLVLTVAVSTTTPPASAATTEAPEPTGEVLAVFVQPSDDPASRHFTETVLPELHDTVRALGIEVRVLDAAEGAPEEVAITPLMVFHGFRGRAVFQGRAFDVGKLVHFIRTRRAVSVTSEAYPRKNIPVLARGRSTIASPIKITPLAGALPAGHDPAAFEARARRAIDTAFEHYAPRDAIRLGPADRLFYMDFHPFRSDDGQLWLSAALFSQFNCIEPVAAFFDQPLSGPYDQLESVFAQAARQLEVEVFRQLAESPLGDGFVPVAANTPTTSWDALDLRLPERPTHAMAATDNLELPTRWRIAKSEDGAPRLVFAFPAPLDRYSGEVAEIHGLLELGADADLERAGGWVEAKTSTVTMGEDALDNALREKMIYAPKFPTARFELDTLTATDGDPSELAFGRATHLAAEGRFILMGIPIPLQVIGTIEPIVGADGAPRLQVVVSYRIRLANPFGVAGPDGPAPANDTLNFNMSFSMVEAPPA